MDIRSFFKPKGNVVANGIAKSESKDSPTLNSKKRKTLSESSPESRENNNNNNGGKKLKGRSKPKKAIDFESDDDDDDDHFVPATPPVAKKTINKNADKTDGQKKSLTKKKNVIDSDDSDGEDFAPKSKKVRSETPTTTITTTTTTTKAKEKPTIVSASHYFGKSTPKAKDPPAVQKLEKQKDNIGKTTNDAEKNGNAPRKTSSEVKIDAKKKKGDVKPERDVKVEALVDRRVEALKPSSSSQTSSKEDDDIVDFDDDDDDFEKSIQQLDESIHEAEKNTDLEKVAAVVVDDEKKAKIEEKEGKKVVVGAGEEKVKKPVISASAKREEKVDVDEEDVKREGKNDVKKELDDGKNSLDSTMNDSGFANTLTANYRNYQQREGPKNPGSKEIPEGAPNCLEGLTFVITGVLESLERSEAQSIIEKYGGKVTGSVSKRTSYAVIGREAGPSKIQKVKDLKVKTVDEDGLLRLIADRPGKKSKFEVAAKTMMDAEEKDARKRKAEEAEEAGKSSKTSKVENVAGSASSLSSMAAKIPPAVAPAQKTFSSSVASTIDDRKVETELWVDKYKPKSLKQIIGQQGDASNVKKLTKWLSNWHDWHTGANAMPVRSTGGRGGPKDDGRGLRAALLSGPPGVGKTTTATLVCQELGFTFVELNASDQRSQKSLKQVVAEALNNHTVVDFVNGGKSASGGQKHCLIMDEVDGMAGNEDRGGMAELIQLIKKTHIPIITMCNDRQSQKVRSLSGYAFDLRFYRPRPDQIKGAIMSICFKEGVKIQPPTLNNIIAMANHDIRQIIHNLSMWTADSKDLTYQKAELAADKAKKNLKIGPFEAIRKVFETTEETRQMSFVDKSDLFFHDYSLAPLFVQENYVNVVPNAGRGSRARHLRLLSRAASSIAAGDLIDRKIRSNQNWSLLPTQAVFASVIPGEVMRGNWTGGMPTFPSWLGKHSKSGKSSRQLQELRAHMRLNVSGSTKDLMLDYMTPLVAALTKPLVVREADGVADVIKVLDDYDLLKEDMDSLLELDTWPGKQDPMAGVASKV